MKTIGVAEVKAAGDVAGHLNQFPAAR
jgi:hypothetical protein